MEAIYLPQPKYPAAANKVGISGKIDVQILIDTKGNVVKAKVLSGHPLLRSESVKAALKEKFTPRFLSGNPVMMYGSIVYKYSLDEQIPDGKKEDSEKLFDAPISLGILNERAIYLPKPVYPKSALQPRSQGNVGIQIKINVQQGKVVLAKAISGNPVFRKYAEMAAMEAKFQPKNVEGVPLFAKGILVFKHPASMTSVGRAKTAKGLPIIIVGLVNKRAIELPKPVFPKACRCEGTIRVRIIVDESGKVIDASVTEGYPLLQAATIQAARQTKFSPTYHGGGLFIVAFLEYVFSSNGQVKT